MCGTSARLIDRPIVTPMSRSLLLFAFLPDRRVFVMFSTAEGVQPDRSIYEKAIHAALFFVLGPPVRTARGI